MKIKDFRENPRFSQKSEIFAKIRDFRKNPRFSRKSEIFAQIPDFRKKKIRVRRRRRRLVVDVAVWEKKLRGKNFGAEGPKIFSESAVVVVVVEKLCIFTPKRR